MAPTKVADPFGGEDVAPVEEEGTLPSVHGDSPIVEAHPPVPLDLQIAALQREVAEGNENARAELEAVLARRDEEAAAAAPAPKSALELAENAQEQRSEARPGTGRRGARRTQRNVRAVGDEAIEEVTPRRDDLADLSLEEKVDRVLDWMSENAPKLDAVLQAYRNFERERELATEEFDYQCVECGTITKAARPEHRTSPDQAVKCPKCFPTKGLTPHDILQYQVAS